MQIEWDRSALDGQISKKVGLVWKVVLYVSRDRVQGEVECVNKGVKHEGVCQPHQGAKNCEGSFGARGACFKAGAHVFVNPCEPSDNGYGCKDDERQDNGIADFMHPSETGAFFGDEVSQQLCVEEEFEGDARNWETHDPPKELFAHKESQAQAYEGCQH